MPKKCLIAWKIYIPMKNTYFNVQKITLQSWTPLLYIMKRSQEDMSKRHQILETQLEQIVNRINNATDELHQNKIRELFSSWSIYTTLVIINIQRAQTSINDVLADTHHGRINHLLISPQQLSNEVAKIRNHLPSGLRFPVEPENLLNLYSLMSVQGQITTTHKG